VAQVRAVALTMTKVGMGILGLALFVWTPATGKGMLVFFSLLVVLIILAIVLSKHKKREDESCNLRG
jgi:uncharacterized membrane protein